MISTVFAERLAFSFSLLNPAEHNNALCFPVSNAMLQHIWPYGYNGQFTGGMFEITIEVTP
jgi:hypothetical protein